MASSYREIERKFLAQPPPETAGVEHKRIEQGYLVIAGGSSEPVEVRLRRVNHRETLLTVKNRAGGSERVEVEIPIQPEQFDALWPATEGRRIVKHRYRFPLPDGLVAEYDDYQGNLAGLKVIEVEFKDADQARHFVPPAWFGQEVTGDPKYSNAQLALRG
ncbi:MAG: CYTH domain-containing protein [Verrucomicrobia bacterium]|nr:CYTH domain-containing protein [Verrucomicrobiota bacterium]